MTTMYYAVVATQRSDLTEWVAALVSSYALARVAGWDLLAARPGLLRCRVRWVDLTRQQVNEIVERWGREDAAVGRLVTHADRLPPAFRAVYLHGYRAATGGTDP